jgi:ribose/xylose/arabinose/galactoside ABC-type transport system permease subunit
MGWPNYIQEIIIGAIIVLAVALDRVRARWSEAAASTAEATA